MRRLTCGFTRRRRGGSTRGRQTRPDPDRPVSPMVVPDTLTPPWPAAQSTGRVSGPYRIRPRCRTSFPSRTASSRFVHHL
jgi:hypothetical protein